jgi:hypothetical protein
MKHPSLHDTQLDAAAFLGPAPPAPLTRAEKRARWAEILEAAPSRVRAFDSIELIRPSRRTNMRADQSALALAFADPVLRNAGLGGDSYGEGRAFFELSHNQMHKLMCRCHIGSSEPGRVTAQRLRRLDESPFAPIGRAFAGMTRAISARSA